MTPKEKSKQLVHKYKPYASSKFIVDNYVNEPMQLINAKQCALIAVDLVLDNLEDHTGEDIKYWQEVKQEIEKL